MARPAIHLLATFLKFTFAEVATKSNLTFFETAKIKPVEQNVHYFSKIRVSVGSEALAYVALAYVRTALPVESVLLSSLLSLL